MKDIYVKPAPGRLVRHPETGEIVPEGGMAVPRVSYWLRRVKDGDVVQCANPMADDSRAVCRADSAETAPTELASGGMVADSKRVKTPATPKE